MSKQFSLTNINKNGKFSKPAGFNFSGGGNQSNPKTPRSVQYPSPSTIASNSDEAEYLEDKQSPQFKYPPSGSMNDSLSKKRTYSSESDSHGLGHLQHHSQSSKATKQKFSVTAPVSLSQTVQGDHQRPGTACAPPRISFPRPASESESTGTGGNNPFFQNQNDPANALSLIFQSSHQMQQEALSVLMARQADLEKIQKQKNSLTRELECAKRESEKLKTDALDLKTSLSIQKKWNSVVDIRLKGLISARDSILHCLQIIRAKSHHYQTSIEELEKDIAEVKNECIKQNELRLNLESENEVLKKNLSAATSEIAIQSNFCSEMKGAISRNSSELSSLINKLSIENDSKFNQMHSFMDQSKLDVSKKLITIINHNSELEKSVAEFENRFGSMINSSAEKQISVANEIQSRLTLRDAEKEAYCKELKDTFAQQLIEKEKQFTDQSLVLEELIKDKQSLSMQVAELNAHSASLQARLDILTQQHSSAMEKLQSDLEEGEKLLLSSKMTVASLSEQLCSSKKEITTLETKLSDLNQEIFNLTNAVTRTNHELADSAAKLTISQNEISSLLKENELLRDRGNLNTLIENRLEKVVSVLSSKEEKEINHLRLEMTDLQKKYESLVSQNADLKNRELALNKKIEDLQTLSDRLDSENGKLAPEFSSRISQLERLLKEEKRISDEKAKADATSIISFKEKLTQKEQDLENCKYKADSELKALKEKNDALQRDLDNLRLNRNMSRSLSDIEAQRTGNWKSNQVSSLAAVKKEAVSARSRTSKRGSSKHSANESKGNQRKINEKISPSESFDLFEAPF